MDNKTLKNLYESIKQLPLLAIPVAVIVACAFLAIALVNNEPENQLQSNSQFVYENGEVVPVTFTNNSNQQIQIKAEIANTPTSIEKGLMNRSSLPIDRGMLFIFPSANLREFWMKDTLIPLDMIFIDTNKKIINIVKNAEPLDESRNKYISLKPSLYVIEVNGGFTDTYGIEPGSIVSF